jgi:glycosyltransferase involved in cell wall biosynthesis|tara:strand:- start:1452 stop:2495 length:1044 start_codon:yes stop_codon:yes gene_type:complete
MEINFKKNIIHIFWSFTSGGAEYLVKDISENSSNLFNHTIIVINNHYDLDLVNSFKTNIKFILLNRKPSTLNIKWFIKFIRSVLSIDNKIIHCHNYSLGYLIQIFFFTPKYLTVHGFDTQLKSYKLFDKIVCVSYPLSNYIENKFNVKTITILNGVNNKLIKIKKNYNKRIKLLFIGRFNDNIKGLDILIKAFKLVADQNDNVDLIIYGKGNKKSEYEYYIKSNDIDNRVFFKGLLNRKLVYDSLCRHDISVIPSRKESFSLFAVESMMAKVPIIVSNIQGLGEVSGKYSLKFETENSKDLANCIFRAMDEIKNNKIVSRTQMSFDYANSNYNMDLMLKNYNKLYKT